MTETFFWHDYETFGADPRRDRPAQFAGLRTNARLEPVAEPVVWYCKPADDLLPHPDACRITGITPQMARDKGLIESEFAARIHEEMSVPGTCGIGYNNFRFDDEVGRHMFYRNFLDPYSREWANGNSRLDLIDILRLTAALRPAGIEWPRREDGTPSFRLEDVAAANGLDTSRAHDALADVEATLGMARLLCNQQPRLWKWALGLRDRWTVERLLGQEKVLLHVSGRYPAARHCIAPVAVVDQHPKFRGQWLVWDLRVDPEPFMALATDVLPDLLWTAQRDLPEELERLPVKLLRSNRAPMLAPMNVLRPEDVPRLEISPDEAAERRHRLLGNRDFVRNLAELFSPARTGEAEDPELALYDGFIPDTDRNSFPRIRSLGPDRLGTESFRFDDERLDELLFRYRARNWPEFLDEEEQKRWNQYRRARLIDDPALASIRIPEFHQRLDELEKGRELGPEIVSDLRAWVEEIDPDRAGL